MMRPSVEDTLLIHDLYARYSWALDTGDTESYVQLYLPDAVVFETRPEGVREAAGHDEIRALVMRFHGDPGFPGRQHRTSQLVISPDPEGRADHWFVRSYVLTTDTKAGSAPTLYWSGHTADIVAKLGGRLVHQTPRDKAMGRGCARAFRRRARRRGHALTANGAAAAIKRG